jgi:hypothetical protein
MATDEEREPGWVRAIGPVLTLGALVLIAVHLIWPHVRIDSVTLVLLASSREAGRSSSGSSSRR